MRALSAYRRPGGGLGVRNHLLVLPSVVCATHAAHAIGAGEGAIAITHQHGCLHVGDDLLHTESVLEGVAANPNVGAAIVVSLGCETLRAKALAERIAQRGKPVELVGIQAAGGTAAAVERGREAVGELRTLLAGQSREQLEGQLIVGLDDRCKDERSAALRSALSAARLRAIDAPDGLQGAEAHVELAAAGAQLILSRPPEHEAPMGFACAPVLAVARGGDLHQALADDFDVAADEDADPAGFAATVVERLLAVAAGTLTAAERRGAADFVLRRLAVTM